MTRITRTNRACLTLAGLLLPASALAQEYTQVEAWLISRLPGHTADLGAAMVDHNAEFHAEAPNGSSVFYFFTGPNADKYQYVVGPRTFSDMDQQEITPEHSADWRNVMRDARLEGREFWRRVDDLSYEPDGMPDEPYPVSVVRVFEVVDVAAFQEGQRLVAETMAAMGSPYPRSVWRRLGQAMDGQGWVAITSFPNWAALDEGIGNFQETFRETKGDDAWEAFQETQSRAFTSRQDSYRVRVQPS
jgi:hypothetical protein